MPKFLADDLPLFAAIVSDMFPGVEVPFISYGNLQTAIEYSLSANNFQVPRTRCLRLILKKKYKR